MSQSKMSRGGGGGGTGDTSTPNPPAVELSTGTRVVLPPLPDKKLTVGGGTAVNTNTSTSTTTAASSLLARSPSNLLDVFDTYAAGYRNGSGPSSRASAGGAGADKSRGSPSLEPDPIAFLNQHYNSEALLVSELPNLRDSISARMDRLDDRLAAAVQRQSESSALTQRRVEEAKANVSSLEERIRRVQTMASQSESTVREITKDMKRLDCAKRHLQRTITTLKRLHMLIHAVERLRLACITQPFPDYTSAAQLVDATRLLLQFFDPHTDKVEAIRLLTRKVDDLQDELKYSLVRGFRLASFSIEETIELEKKSKNTSFLATDLSTIVAASDDGDDDEVIEEPRQSLTDPTNTSAGRTMTEKLDINSMIGGVQLIDSIGVEARIEFMTGFIQDHLLEYSKIFKPVKEQETKEKPRVSSFMAQPVDDKSKEEKKPDFALEFIEKRFLWLRNLLAELQRTYPGVFPRYWNLEYHLTKNFLRRTRSHLLGLLSGATKDPDANNATILLKALQKTIVFEKEVSAGLQSQFGVVFVNQATDGDRKSNSSTPAASKKADANTDQSGVSKEQTPVEPLLGLASSAFDKHMRPYIALEEQSMDEQLVAALEEKTVDLRGSHPVLTSSTQMFVYIRGSITRCTALTKGNTFFLLYKSFQDCLRKYSQVLISKLPSSTSQKAPGALMPPVPFAKQSLDSSSAVVDSYIVPPGEEVTVCHVVGTAEYCAETVEALEDLIRDTIDDEFKSKIDMSDQQEAFHDITAKAIGILVSGIENRLADSFRMMETTNWGIFAEVGEESEYVGAMNKTIHPYVATARSLIPKSYFQSLCDKLASRITTLYYESVIRLKIISEPGSQQLLLDVYNLKTLLLKLPVLEKSNESTKKSASAGTTIAPAMYTKMVQKQFKKIELLLKMCATPTNLLVTVFKDQWPGGSAADFQQVLSLKGMKRTEQAAMLEKFGLDAATARKGATANITSSKIMTERFQAVQDQASKVDISQMRQKVSSFRNSFLQA